MDNAAELFSRLADYQPALLALTILCLAVLAQSTLAGVLGFGKSGERPGHPLQGGHGDLSFRAIRTYANSTENLPAFAITVILAIIVGVTPTWVNWLAAIHVALRLVYWVIYTGGIGAAANGPRTIVYVMGLLANVVLAVRTLVAFF